MELQPSDVYWIQRDSASGLEPGMAHPHVILQDDGATVLACAMTSNLKRLSMPGNVLLEADEAGLPKPSVVEVSKVWAAERSRIGAYIGSLSPQRFDEIMAGMRFVERSFLTRDDSG